MSSQCKKDADELEGIQGRATRMVGLQHLPIREAGRAWSIECFRGLKNSPSAYAALGNDGGLPREAVQSPSLESTTFVGFRAQTG